MQLTVTKLFTAFGITMLALLQGCDAPRNNVTDKRISESELAKLSSTSANQTTFYFGFDLRASPQEDAKQYAPFLKYLNKTTGYTFRLRFTSKNENIIHNLKNDVIQFASIGAVSLIKAQQQDNIIPLARGLNNNNKAEYRSFIVIANNSKITSIADLKRKRFAFGSKTSTQGHLIPRIILSNAGLTLKDFQSYIYTGSHSKCAQAVIERNVDACGMQDTLALELAKQGKLKILHKSSYYPSSGIVAKGDLPAEALESVTRALVDFDPINNHALKLYNWHKTEMPNGFKIANSDDYDLLQKAVFDFGI